ncbi:peptigoglycan-binding protein LysM [Streptomyces fodineus]|uniref:Peptigoglycan-binding protein LysM n=1 Tax=Streptomyces fodineus TaxID=1904616 RepID=A0A1D7YE68_9ACTN|nr:transglycosylase family protein [Streptomyces fodineus]AOR33851.1 peptigoglycan-binding protein LysM [Streptomyces fodineus]
MLSGNGRHRRPRQAPALLVAAGVTGSAIAIPLLGAASANAADGTTWDKVAECESGGSWSADTGNGYYGGLQISSDDWDKYGGTQYAESADQASRSQQIAVAEKILADQGTKPWAMCALTAGLTSHSGSVDVDTGVGGPGGSGGSGGSNDTSGSSGGSDSSGLPDSSSSGIGPGSDSGANSGANSGSGSDSDPTGSNASGSPSDTSATPAPSPSKDATENPDKAGGTTGTNAPKSDKNDKTGSPGGGDSQGSGGSPAATPGTDDSDNSQQNSSSWSLIDTGALSSGGRHRGGSADESVANGQNPTPSGRHADRDAGTYTVREGDSLASIADSLGVDGGWHALYDGNKKVIGADPNHITAGQTLKVGGEKDGE